MLLATDASKRSWQACCCLLVVPHSVCTTTGKQQQQYHNVATTGTAAVQQQYKCTALPGAVRTHHEDGDPGEREHAACGVAPYSSTAVQVLSSTLVDDIKCCTVELQPVVYGLHNVTACT